MPFTPLSTAILVCEKVLAEKDNVLSAIRIVDAFKVPQSAPKDSQVDVSIIVVLKGATHQPDERFSITFQHELPDGSVQQVGESETISMTPSGDSSIPPGTTFWVTFSVNQTYLGTHVLHVLIDGLKVGRAYFTLLGYAKPAA